MSIWWDRYLWIHSKNISWPTNVLRGKHCRTSKADSVKLWEFRQIVVRLFSVLKSRFWRPKGGGLKGSSGKWFVCWVCRIRPNVLAPFLKTLRWRDPNITTYPLFRVLGALGYTWRWSSESFGCDLLGLAEVCYMLWAWRNLKMMMTMMTSAGPIV